jgi:pyridoxine/pyridoxamine 5'-phosphate oxidase
MQRSELLEYLRRQPWAVEATTSPAGAPQAAVIGVAITDALEIVFDTLGGTRKAANLRRDPRVALVVGWDEAQTAQIEGVADEPTGDDLERCKKAYFARFPDGPTRLSWPGITYVRVRPTWIRYTDFRGGEPRVHVFDEAALRG